MSKLVLYLSVLALAGLGFAACGSDDDAGDGATDVNPETDSLEVSAVPDGSFSYEEGSLSADAGRLTVSFRNPAPIAHDFCIEDSGGDDLGCTSLIADGDSTTQQYELEPGEYTFYCSVAGHRSGGMEGPLTVE